MAIGSEVIIKDAGLGIPAYVRQGKIEGFEVESHKTIILVRMAWSKCLIKVHPYSVMVVN